MSWRNMSWHVTQNSHNGHTKIEFSMTIVGVLCDIHAYSGICSVCLVWMFTPDHDAYSDQQGQDEKAAQGSYTQQSI